MLVDPLSTILRNAQGTADVKATNSHNPETYTFLAMAAYILLHPLDGQSASLYMGPWPVDASKPFG